MMQLLIAGYLFLIGACLGSFAGAVAWRLEKRRNFVKERSECEHCHHVLSPKDLIPVISWVWLRGRCRYCKKPIGVSALLLELGLGTVFVVSYLMWPFSLENVAAISYFVLWLVALTGLAILFIYDLRHFLLPDKVMAPLVLVGLLLFGLRAVMGEWQVSQIVLEILLCLIPVSGVYYVLHIVSGGKWVGFGDVKLGVFIGLALGWQGALLTLFLANIIAMVTIAPALLTKRLGRTDHVPFGPFLIVATWLSLLFSEPLIAWYLSLMVI